MEINSKHMKPRYLVTLTVYEDTNEDDLRNIMIITKRLAQVFDAQLTEII